jgi:uncharacterized membrane protein
MNTTAVSVSSGLTDTQRVVPVSSTRLVSIDIFRGLIMALMALDHTRAFFTNLPFIPLAAVMAGGYAFGEFYLPERGRRRKLMARLALGLILAFVVLRVTNLCFLSL